MTTLRTSLHSLMLILLLLGASLAVSATEKLSTVPEDKKNVVQFTSAASLETIVGRTSAITGRFELDKENLTASGDGFFEVDLGSLDTGINLRNQHMRENYLNTAAYPKALFNLKKVVSADATSLKDGDTATLMCLGDFTIHGVSKEYTIPVKVTYLPHSAETEQRLGAGAGDAVVVQADWTVKLADHSIERPQFLLLRLAEEQKVSVSFVMTDKLPEKK
jgi:polyisoprenoid-binding protein YceI